MRFLQASGFSPQSVSYRYHASAGAGSKRLLHGLYRVLPKRFRREIVVVARKTQAGPTLEPLIPPETGGA